MAIYYGFYTDVGSVGGDAGVLVASTIPGAPSASITVKLHKSGAPPWQTTMTTDSAGFANVVLPAPLAYTQLIEVTTSPTIALSLTNWAGPQTNFTVIPPESKTKGSLFYATSQSVNNQIFFGNPSSTTVASVSLYYGSGGLLTTLSVPAKMAVRYTPTSFGGALKATSTLPVVCGAGIMNACSVNMVLFS